MNFDSQFNFRHLQLHECRHSSGDCEKWRKLAIFATVEMHEAIERRPSWVPDWSMRGKYQKLPEALASGRSKTHQDFEREGGGIMQVQGKTVDSILLVESFHFPNWVVYQSDWEIVVAEVKRVLSRLKLATDVDLAWNLDHPSLNLAFISAPSVEFSVPIISPSASAPATNRRALSEVERELVEVLSHPSESWANKALEVFGAILVYSGIDLCSEHHRGILALHPTLHDQVIL